MLNRFLPSNPQPTTYNPQFPAMTEPQKTLTYLAVAAVMAVAGIFLAPRGPQPTKDGGETLIGTEFYKDFTNPSEVTSIQVISYDPATATVAPFSVEYKDGLWRIPTRYNYPADAKDRLAKAAASVIGLKREALAGKSEAEQAEFQVLDPQAEKTENLKGVGNRLTLRNGDTVLADYIIGKQDPNRPGYYYVRKPEEKQTFIAKVELDLSTKFTDWIEPDVLNLDGLHLTYLDVMKHTLEISRTGPELVGSEDNVLTRKTSSDPWKLEGLDDAAVEVNQETVRKLVDALDNLKIVGVRPKPESLRQDLRENEGLKLSQEIAEDLMDRGFFILRAPRGGVQMVSKEGDLVAGTDQAVEYEMHFGSVFEGTEEEIELGFTKKAEEDAKEGENKEPEQTDDGKDGAKKKSRFIFVTARVNPALLGPEPEEPVKPEPPTEEELKRAIFEDAPADALNPNAEPIDPQKSFDESLKKYEADKKKFEADVKSRDEKLKEAEEKIKSLNARFADWYYVISAENFENLRPGRSELVKEKSADPTTPGTGNPFEGGAAPGIPEFNPDTDSDDTSSPSEEPSDAEEPESK